MKRPKREAGSLFDAVVNDLELQLKGVSSYALRLLEENGSLIGVCFLSKNFSRKKREAVEKGIQHCSGLLVESTFPKKISPDNIILLPQKSADDAEIFQKWVGDVFQQAILTRIPFAVLILHAHSSGVSQREKTIFKNTVLNCAKHDERVCPIDKKSSGKNGDDTRYAFILPSSGLSKARRRAEELHSLLAPLLVSCSDAVCQKGASAGGGKAALSIGLGVSYAGDHPNCQAFIGTVEQSLAEALRHGETIRWQQSTRTGNSCQVTAEERAQLFGFLKEEI